MASDFLPKSEDDLVKWATHFVTLATANATTIGLTVPQVNTFGTKVTELSSKRQIAEDKRTAAKAATEDKEVTLRVVGADCPRVQPHNTGQDGRQGRSQGGFGLKSPRKALAIEAAHSDKTPSRRQR